MVLSCASSAKLALPTVLRSVFRSELTCDLPSSPVHHWTRLRQFQHRSHFQHSRLFTSNSRSLQSHSDGAPSTHPTPEPSHSLPSSPSSESTSQSENTTTSSASPSENQSQGEKPGPESRTRKNNSKNEIRKHKEKKTESRKSQDGQEGKGGKNRKPADKDKKDDKAKKVPKKPKKPESWEIQKGALEKKFPDGWNPAKRLSPDALDGIRHLHATAPEQFTTAVLAEEFKVSPEAIRRILKSKWRPSEGEMESRRVRWENRHDRIWSQMAELGLRPPTKRSRSLSDTLGLYNGKKK